MADTSKLVNFVVVQRVGADTSKLVDFVVSQRLAADAAKLVNFVVLDSNIPVRLTGRVSGQSQSRGTIDVSPGITLSGRISGMATGSFGLQVGFAGNITAANHVTGSISTAPTSTALSGRIFGMATMAAVPPSFGFALSGRIEARARLRSNLRILIPLPPGPAVPPPPPIAVYEIPMTGGAPSFQVIRLSGWRYQLAVHWCDPLGVWVLDIADVDNNPIISGIPMVTGADLLEQYRYLNLGGALVAQSDFDWTMPPSFDDLGLVGHLYWIPYNQPGLTAQRYPLSPQDPREPTLHSLPPPVPG